MNKIQVDDGYIQLVDYMGSGDLTVVNAARVSFGKRKDVLDDSDVVLINYLAENKHMSPFRHMQFTFVIHTSEVVCRQMYKHQVGMGYTSGEFKEVATVWNEMSGRYTAVQEFHYPTAFRRQHTTNRQASTEGVYVEDNEKACAIYNHLLVEAQKAYAQLLELGVCREQARMVLPVSFMTTVTLTCSLEAAVHFIKLRDHEGAQLEIRNLARAMKTLIDPICPVSIQALLK